ncbi:MAG: hypothetical protein NTV80_12215, partial [Verrucomicrobia bacterium]|nr:hypothetical protein [Verrucomicrobiota bacterium]
LFLFSSLKAQSVLESLDEALTLSTTDGEWRADVSGLLDLEAYLPEEQALGLVETDDEVFLNPRLTLLFDFQMTQRWRAHVQMRTDRGFDPGFAVDGETRLDEYFIEWRPLDNDVLNLRAGKFATAFGAWTSRRLSWDNPFVTAPAAYSDMLPVTDSAAASLAGFAGRRNAVENRQTWVPILWGPSYASGVSIFGRTEHLDYALEVKNAAISSRPDTWDAVENGWDSTTYSGRLGWRPAPEWNFGTSFSHGAYLLEESQPTLPAGRSYRDYNQTTFGVDAGYSHGHWQLWAELMTSRFEVPNVGGVRVVSGFIEARRKLNATTWLAARWNQSWFGDIPGTSREWDRDGWRLDLALGHRLSRNMQAKLQYSIAERTGQNQEGNHLLAVQLTLSF